MMSEKKVCPLRAMGVYGSDKCIEEKCMFWTRGTRSGTGACVLVQALVALSWGEFSK